MNEMTFEKLEYNKLKEKVKDYCSSSLGAELLEKLTPSADIDVVENRLTETKEACALIGAEGKIPLIGIDQIDVLLERCSKGEILDPSNLMQIYDFLRGCRKVKEYMESSTFYAPVLATYATGIMSYKEMEEEIGRSIAGHRVSSAANKELGKIRDQIEKIEVKINEKLKTFLNNPGNKDFIQDSFISKRGDYYTVPIKTSYKNHVPGTIVEISSKGSTVFMEPSSISKLNNELIIKRAEESMIEYQILASLTGLVVEHIYSMNTNKDIMGKYDLIFAKARYSLSTKGIKPKLNNIGNIKLVKAIHPLLPGPVVPLDFELGKEHRGLIITGPNAGGKTMVLKTIGLLTLATLSGFFISAHEETEIAVFDKVFVDIGDNQSSENALSTFSSHIKNIADIMRMANNNSLLLFDEIGSGTEPNEGAALAISILEEFYQMGCISISTTHYGEIKRFSELHPDFINAAMQFKQETLEPTYKLTIGKSGDSNALWISRRMKLREKVVQRAKEYMESKEYQLTKVREEKVRKTNDSSYSKEEQHHYKKGDKVFLIDHNDSALIYEEEDKYRNVVVFFKEKFLEINVKRIELEFPATELYPKDYDLDTLFTDFKTRKLEHDIQRGSKKALRKIQKEMKKTNGF